MLDGRRVWVNCPAYTYSDKEGKVVTIPAHLYDTRVLHVKSFHAADKDLPEHVIGRRKHLVQLYTDTGVRTLSVGQIHLKDPRKG